MIMLSVFGGILTKHAVLTQVGTSRLPVSPEILPGCVRGLMIYGVQFDDIHVSRYSKAYRKTPVANDHRIYFLGLKHLLGAHKARPLEKTDWG